MKRVKRSIVVCCIKSFTNVHILIICIYYLSRLNYGSTLFIKTEIRMKLLILLCVKKIIRQHQKRNITNLFLYFEFCLFFQGLKFYKLAKKPRKNTSFVTIFSNRFFLHERFGLKFLHFSNKSISFLKAYFREFSVCCFVFIDCQKCN